MATPGETRQPSPELFFETMNAYERTASLKAAIELDLFTAIGEGSDTPGSLARRCQASERGMRILCDYLVVIGFLTKRGAEYALTPDTSVLLDRRSPAYLGSAVRFLGSPQLTACFQDIAAIVRKGGTLLGPEGTLAAEHPLWVEFARAMAPMMTLAAELIARLLQAHAGHRWKVLDVAAGHGLFGITLAKHNPNAEIVAVDWPNVLEVAKENAQKAGVAGRWRASPGSAFDVELGTGYDIALLTNFLHHFDSPTIEEFLRKVHAALASGGRAVALEFVPNEDRISPPIAAAFSMQMLGTTSGGDAYTFSEYQQMFHNAGFSATELHSLPPTPQSVIIAKK